ncbi:uncharacterized protein CDAR_234851 [Caerostris darwini]|uniref:RING-type domain-containing protein n=1 Tax=Caerostris darwini TaxID=1538125 RepID=A0AAV4SZI7_9ARAC|nr:uncharacterized protein CDAR_234851 [Caerostris darwini]
MQYIFLSERIFVLSMNIIHDELKDIKNHCESQIPGSKVIACVPSMVRVDLRRTKYKQLTVCLQFPELYPQQTLLIELKSKTLCDKFLNGLTKICEEECKKLLGKPQILKVLKFLKQFIDENPLSVCSDEVSLIKRKLDENDQIKLKQKTSSLSIHIMQGLYFGKVKAMIPDVYPEEQVQIELTDCNFPRNFEKWFSGQSMEIARQCVQKPLKPKPKDPPFKPKPSLWPSVEFIIDEIKRFPKEICQLCKEKCFPPDPTQNITEEGDEKHIEKVYCGHIFHNACLDIYMKTPPFHGGKKCPSCGKRIYHEKWKITPKLAEDRWAHQEAKKRELGEVVEFFE